MQEREEKYTLLYKIQDKIIDLVVKEKLGFYLTGGTALQRFYFNKYRYSDDLDLFLMDNGTSKAESKEFQKFLDALEHNSIEYKVNTSTPYFKRIFLKENCLKIDLVNDFVYHEKDFVRANNGIYLDSLQNIFVNKLETSLSRTEPRDLFDIYIILSNHKIDIEKSFQLLNKKSNLETKLIIENLSNIDISKINLNQIQFKNEKVLKDFINGFNRVIMNNFLVKNINNVDTIFSKAREKLKKNKESLENNRNKINQEDCENLTYQNQILKKDNELLEDKDTQRQHNENLKNSSNQNSNKKLNKRR